MKKRVIYLVVLMALLLSAFVSVNVFAADKVDVRTFETVINKEQEDGKRSVFSSEKGAESYEWSVEPYDAVSGDHGIALITRYNLYVSTDGYDWQEIKLKGADNEMHWRVSYALDKYVVHVYVDRGTNYMYVSDDLFNWSRSTQYFDFDVVDAVTYGGKMIAYGRDDNNGQILSSTDGHNWSVLYTHEDLIDSIVATDRGLMFTSRDYAYRTENFIDIEQCDTGDYKAEIVYESEGKGYILAWSGTDDGRLIFEENGDGWTNVNEVNLDGSGNSSSVPINDHATVIASPFRLDETILLGSGGAWQMIDPVSNESQWQDAFRTVIFDNKIVTMGSVDDWGTGTSYGVNLVTTDPVKINLDNNLLMGMDVPPTVVDGRTLIPVRKFFEAIGATVGWDGETSTVTVESGNKQVKIQIDSTTAMVNDQVYTLDVAATIIDGRTMVPIRFVSEAFGYNVSWDGSSRTVGIATK